MRARSVAEVAAAVRGSVRGQGKALVRRVVVDSRQAGPGAVKQFEEYLDATQANL